MGAARLAIFLLGALALAAQVSFYPLSDVRPGQMAVGRTVFNGSEIEEFDVEILGVLENSGPKQSIILARLSGGPLERTGVLQGMSGSPVYIDGRLIGAVALGFSLSKEPLAGIRPIEEMMREGGDTARNGFAQPSLWARDLTAGFDERPGFLTGGSRMVEIATPVSFSGFTAGTIEQFAPQLRKLGLEPTQGLTGGGGSRTGGESSEAVVPGSMISVMLLEGDLRLGADGTVTHVDGDRVFAFGHRFLSVGATSLPFRRSEVITLAPNLATSFKISAAQEPRGAITADYSTAVSGRLGAQAETVPISIRVNGPNGARESSYRIEMVNDRFLSPFLLQMALYSAIDATERTVGTSSVSLTGQVRFQNGVPPVRLDEMYAGNGNVPLQASLGAAVPLAYLLQSGFDALRLEEIELSVDVFDERRQWVIDQVWPVRKSVEAGQDIELMIALVGENGEERIEQLTYPVPPGEPEGTLHFTAADGSTTNLLEYRHLAGRRMQTADRVVSLVNELRNNTGVYVRVWRAENSYLVQGRQLPAPPPSVAFVLGSNRSTTSGSTAQYSSKIREFRLDGYDAVVTGHKTVQVEITE